MYNEKETQVLSTVSKVLEQLKIPPFIVGKWYQEKKCLKIYLAVEIIQEKENVVNVSTVLNLKKCSG